MKITNIQNIPIQIPYLDRVRPHLAYGWQTRQEPVVNTHIYIVETDEGLTGYGEGPDLGDQTQSYIGHSPFEYLLDDRAGACQIAFYDLMAQYINQPVYRLFGPQVKDRVRMAFWSHCFRPDILAAEAQFALENGFRLHKIKSRPFETSAEQVAAMAAVIPPDYRIMIDANGSWQRPAEALRNARNLQAYPNVWALETPIPQDHIEGYKFLKSHLDYPIAIHSDTPPVLRAVTEGLCDYFVSEFDGANKLLHDCHIARAAENREFWVENGLWSGISHAFQLHQAAATANIYLLITLAFLAEDDMIVEPMTVENGTMAVPQTAGLGVTLDMNALEKYRLA